MTARISADAYRAQAGATPVDTSAPGTPRRRIAKSTPAPSPAWQSSRIIPTMKREPERCPRCPGLADRDCRHVVADRMLGATWGCAAPVISVDPGAKSGLAVTLPDGAVLHAEEVRGDNPVEIAVALAHAITIANNAADARHREFGVYVEPRFVIESQVPFGRGRTSEGHRRKMSAATFRTLCMRAAFWIQEWSRVQPRPPAVEVEPATWRHALPRKTAHHVVAALLHREVDPKHEDNLISAVGIGIWAVNRGASRVFGDGRDGATQNSTATPAITAA